MLIERRRGTINMLTALQYRRVWLFAAVPLLSLLAGCGEGQSRFKPTAGEARSSLEAVLTAWRDGKPYGPIEATPPVRVVDSVWEKGQQLESYQIGDEQDAGEGTKKFSVKLKLKKPPADQEVLYFLFGRDPVWVYLEDDYKRVMNMENSPDSTPRSKAGSQRTGRSR
jgi:hypothetical protein